MWADLLPSEFPDSDVEGERRLMYVALTRPEDMLFITCSMESAFVRDIRNTGKVGTIIVLAFTIPVSWTGRWPRRLPFCLM